MLAPQASQPTRGGSAAIFSATKGRTSYGGWRIHRVGASGVAANPGGKCCRFFGDEGRTSDGGRRIHRVGASKFPPVRMGEGQLKLLPRFRDEKLGKSISTNSIEQVIDKQLSRAHKHFDWRYSAKGPTRTASGQVMRSASSASASEPESSSSTSVFDVPRVDCRLWTKSLPEQVLSMKKGTRVVWVLTDDHPKFSKYCGRPLISGYLHVYKQGRREYVQLPAVIVSNPEISGQVLSGGVDANKAKRLVQDGTCILLALMETTELGILPWRARADQEMVRWKEILDGTCEIWAEDGTGNAHINLFKSLPRRGHMEMQHHVYRALMHQVDRDTLSSY